MGCRLSPHSASSLQKSRRVREPSWWPVTPTRACWPHEKSLTGPGGICEAGLTTAPNLGDRIGTLHNSTVDMAPAMRGVRSLGLQSRVAGGRSINVPMSRLDDKGLAFERMAVAARDLERDLQASVLVFGCAAMTKFRSSLEAACGLPVVDPTQAAVGLTITAIRPGCAHAKPHSGS